MDPAVHKAEGGSDKEALTLNCEPEELECRYSWVIVCSCLIIQTLAGGISGAFGVYLDEYQNMYPDTSPATISGIGSLNGVFLAIMGLVYGRLVNWLGYAKISFIGCSLAGIGYILSSFATQVWQLYITQGVLVNLGFSLAFLSSLTLPAEWFTKRRGLAVGIAGSGAGNGGLLFAPFAHYLISRYSIYWCLRITGIIMLALGGGASLTLKQRFLSNDVVGVNLQVIKDKKFQLLLWGCFFSVLGYYIPFYLLPAHAISIGIDPDRSSILLAVFNGCTSVGLVILGFLADNFGKLNVMTFGTLLSGVVPIVIWTPARDFTMLLMFSIFGGMVTGCIFVLVPVVVVNLFPIDQYATISGYLYLALGLAISIGAPLGIGLNDWIPHAPSYTPSIIFCGISGILGAITLIFLRLSVSKKFRFKI